MNPAREALLWASRNELLARNLPRLWFVRATVSKFMPGEELADALDAAERLASQGVPATFTALGENVEEPHQADEVVDHYLLLHDRIQARELDAEVSVKLTHLGMDLGMAETASRLERLVSRAAELGRTLWIDMESTEYVQATLDLYRGLLGDHSNIGICIQAYLHRTPQDVADLLPMDPSIRFVKGAYKEPAELALHSKAQIDISLERLALETLRRRPADASGRLVIATHDIDLIDRVAAQAESEGFGPDDYEIAMLYGIRTKDQVRLASEGFRVRTLIAYGTHWYPWFMRRLAEKPSENILLALRNLFPPRR
jgi:proline dehydrogenase